MKKKKTTPIIEDKYCPECGLKLQEIRVPNENDFYTTPYWAMGYSVNNAGKKFDYKTGKKLYRTEFHCPTTRKIGWLCKKEVSHYILLGEKNLVD